MPDTKAEGEQRRPSGAWHVCWARPFPHTGAPAGLRFLLRARLLSTDRRDSCCISMERDRKGVTAQTEGCGGCGAPASVCERRPGGALRAVQCRCDEPQRSHRQPVCSLKFSMSHLSPWLKSVTWAETSLGDVLTVYPDSDTVRSGIFRKDSFSRGPDFSRPRVSKFSRRVLGSQSTTLCLVEGVGAGDFRNSS